MFVVEAGNEFVVYRDKERVEEEFTVVAGKFFDGYYFIVVKIANFFLDLSAQTFYDGFVVLNLAAYQSP